MPPSSIASWGDECQRLGRGDDRNTGMGSDSEEIGIARDDEISPRCHGECQHGMVVGITADLSWQLRRIDDLGQLPQLTQDPLGVGSGSSGTSGGG